MVVTVIAIRLSKGVFEAGFDLSSRLKPNTREARSG